MTASQPLIRLKNVCFTYPGQGMILDQVSLEVFRGDRIGLVGPNGSGKTTLFHIIMGLLKPTAGRIEIFGKPVKSDKDFQEVYRKVGLLFQDADDQLFSPTVLEDVAFGPLNMGKSRQEAAEIARKTLADLGLASLRIGLPTNCPEKSGWCAGHCSGHGT
ncbi:MAG: ABC transporter ATP-binding protein [Desulfobacterales bacterium]